MDKSLAQTSKFLSLILRHKPDTIGLQLDAQGWATVDDLLTKLAAAGKPLDHSKLIEIVETNDKQRFKFNGDRTRIRASQGHSIAIDLGLAPQTPPPQLFHGTATRFLASIRQQGLLPGSRQHVHLSQDRTTAVKVGQRHGKPVVLVVDSIAMADQGIPFFQSDNGVWLTATVPTRFIQFPD
ncbi:MAG: RNA 2'-phosphotransferase [Cyanobacteria bacterium P01_H01_bin.130]